MSDPIIEKHIATFSDARPLYKAFEQALRSLVNTLLKAGDIDIVTLEGRTKTIDSFRGKITREDKNYTDPMREITDLVGLRIVTYQLADIDAVSSLIMNNFTVDEGNSIDKCQLIEADRFGYLSVHYVVSLNSTRTQLPEYSAFKGLKAEIQVRTVLQHAWSAIDHKLRYKTKEEIPLNLRRKLFRISALLETADSEFETLRAEMAAVRQQYAVNVAGDNLDISLNLDSLQAYLTGSSVSKNIEQSAIAADYVISPYNPDAKRPEFSTLLPLLHQFGITTLTQLNSALERENIRIAALLQKVNKYWKEAVHDKNLKLVVLREPLLRMILPLLVPPEKAAEVIEAINFGTTLTPAVNKAYGELFAAKKA